MKSSLLLAFLLLISQLATGAGSYLDVLAARTQQKVTVEARAQGGLGRDRLQCTITNLTGQELKLRVPPGLHFAAADAGAQDIFTFQQQLLVLAPGASKQLPLWAFCMEANDYSPGRDATYNLQGLAAKGLKPLGDSLQKYSGLADNYGQMFVWSLSDGRDMYPVHVEPALLRGAKNILRYIGKVTGRPTPAATVITPKAPPKPLKTFAKRATLFYHSPTSQLATLKVYNPDGSERNELLKNRPLTAGVVRYTIGLNDIVEADAAPVYTVRLLDPAGKVLKEMKVDDNTTETATEPEKIVFNFPFELKTLVRNAYLRVRLTDGTLVEEVMHRKYLPPGKFRMQFFFNHLYPPGTAFVAQLEVGDGKVLTKEPVVPVAEEPAPAAPAGRRR